MNCQLCRKELDAYREGKLHDDMRTQVEDHLKQCAECADIFRIQSLAESVINQEKVLSPDDYLTSRIMAQIENPEKAGYRTISPFIRILKPALKYGTSSANLRCRVLPG